MAQLVRVQANEGRKSRFKSPTQKNNKAPHDYFTSVPDWARMQMDPYHPEYAMLDIPPSFEQVDVNAIRQLMQESDNEWQKHYSPEDFGYSVVKMSVIMRDGGETSASMYRPLVDEDVETSSSDSSETFETLPLLYVIHGGLFGGSPISEEVMLLRPIMLNFRMCIVSIDYRKAPDYPIPTSLHDAYDALAWSISHAEMLGIDSDRVFLAGTAQGGNMCAALSLMIRSSCTSVDQFNRRFSDESISPVQSISTSLQHTLSLESDTSIGSSSASSQEPVTLDSETIKGVILNVALLCHPAHFPYELEPTSSYVQCFGTFGLNTGVLRQAWSKVAPVLEVDASNPIISPLLSKPEMTENLPPHLVIVAGQDPLRDEGIAYARMLRERGILCDMKIYKGVPHVFAGFENLKSTKLFWDNLVRSMANVFKLEIERHPWDDGA